MKKLVFTALLLCTSAFCFGQEKYSFKRIYHDGLEKVLKGSIEITDTLITRIETVKEADFITKFPVKIVSESDDFKIFYTTDPYRTGDSTIRITFLKKVTKKTPITLEIKDNFTGEIENVTYYLNSNN